MSSTWSPGRFIEMGAGTGHMTRIFLERGFFGASHDLGRDSRQMMRENLSFAQERMVVVDRLSELADESFDYLFAFEVLEHIEKDREVMREWIRYLKPGGRVLISVPAHQRKFGRSDELVGHVRRYEKGELRTLLMSAGVADIHIVNYGFPVTEFTRRLSNRLIKNDQSYDDMTPEQRSVRSAQTKPAIINKALSLISGDLFVPFCFVQRWFYQYDLGDGYVASGIKCSG
ncbi:class I SAM-dependent methyltransferase [Dyella acidisoli]|nr:class I SAM-dependent methyltransferase [Dyella acidisoli]